MAGPLCTRASAERASAQEFPVGSIIGAVNIEDCIQDSTSPWVGANTAILSVVDGGALAAATYAGPERLVVLLHVA